MPQDEPTLANILLKMLAHKSLGNTKARESLGLSEGDYESLKAELLAEGKIMQGRGRGGSIKLAPSTLREPQGSGAEEDGSVAGMKNPAAEPVEARGSSSQKPPSPSPRASTKNQGSAFEQAFRNIDDILWKEGGCSNELDYTEQTSWILFLKYLDDLEESRQMKAELQGQRYVAILEEQYRWPVWACPKKRNAAGSTGSTGSTGSPAVRDYHSALTGRDLVQFVDQRLFPYLRGFKQKATGPNTIEYKIGEIFGELNNKIKSGYNLREILEHVDGLHFRSQAEKHELSALYEGKIQRMGNAGRNGGEYYTPRPLIKAIVQVVDPQIGETIYDGAVGSAGFLCEAFAYMDAKALSTSDHKTLQEKTFYGKEKKSLAYVIGIMNMILHGIEAPNLIHTNTLAENLQDIQPKDQYDVVLANPPFGGKERKEVQQNFPIKTGETAFLFLQHFIKSLKAGGRAGIVIKNTFLSNTDNASISLRRKLLEECDLHTILDLPGGTFQGAGVKTVVLFFTKGSRTRSTWYYQLDPGRNMGKTNPLNDADLAEFVELAKTKGDSAKSWTVASTGSATGQRTVASTGSATVPRPNPELVEGYDLSAKNPNRAEEAPLREPKAILQEMRELDVKTKGLLDNIMELIG